MHPFLKSLSLTLVIGAGVAKGAIVRDGDTVRITSGVLERVIRVSGGNVSTASLTVSGKPLLDGPAGELALRISRATPNRNPLELHADPGGGGVVLEEAKPGVNDSMKVRAQPKTTPAGRPEQVVWTDARSFSAASWQQCFERVNVTQSEPQPGTQRLMIRARSSKDPLLAGVSITLVYEIYADYPVIRKWVEIHNNSANWLKIDNLVTDDLRIGADFGKGVPLTPCERGATASLVGFSQADNTHGVIVASEVPSALRLIQDQGACGYNPEFFEWTLGPAETFVAEPTFLYGFSGETLKTPSAVSLPLDRAVEGSFKEFLREQLGISPANVPIPAPQWATWSNFGPNVNDAIVRQQAAIAGKCGFVLFELDDGWQQGRLGTKPDSKKFPDFDQTCAFIRGQGMRLGLWVSSFREPADADFTALAAAASQPQVHRLKGLAMSFGSDWHKYYANDLLFLHDTYGATYFKQDFSNIKFGDLAAGHASRTRKESYLRGLRGLLDAQDIVRRGAPDIATELTHEIYWATPGVPCDLAALKHASLYHIPPNDYSGGTVPGKSDRPGASAPWHKTSALALRAGLIKGCLNARERLYAHRGLPLECIEYYGAHTVNWQGSLTPEVQDRQICSWLLGAPLLYSGDLASLTADHIARYRLRFDLLKRLEETYGIYRRFQYSGVPAPTDTDWHWWGKLDARGCGAVVVLRGTQGSPTRSINIPWVDRQKQYKLTALFQTKELGTFSGAQLQDGSLSIALPPLGQEILELSLP